ncbi:c-di-GMP-binding flagellar brake protein YcgR [Pullulanibacillus pueri]|uniref:Pilus assembly protein PilZ n=1 Tax=Pullulanibacillus pueri TaxID=1437324 RepID=A0A8J2ZUZ4_9BACL|nr:flagellar brake domain-containing protein [Pullulanibacillus pueri]MBM7681483.1 c-di-GMP-binding flagellar brake protein YcgR [Pullulanibacillus pueri]GGH79060.1 hypothetical protein GCM10007096_13430 [Pullulanibacillus pueri]
MLKKGINLYLELVNEGKKEKYKTKIAEMTDDEIFVELPIHDKTKKFAFFILNTSFKAVYYDSGKVFQFTTVLLRRIKENVPLLVLSFPGEENIKTIQRRQYVRVETSLDVAIHPVVPHQFSPFTTVTLDVSGGGLSVHLPKDYGWQPDQEVDLWLVLPMVTGEYNYCKIRGLFIRQFISGKFLRASFEFKNISKQEHQKLIRYTLEKDLYSKRLAKS